MSEDLEDFCGDEYDRGLDRVWVCSLPADQHVLHSAHVWHNIATEAMAQWINWPEEDRQQLIGYRAFDEWVEL